MQQICSDVVWLIFAVVVVIGDFVRAWYFIKCIGTKDCNDQKCRYKDHCFWYERAITEAESKSLISYIDTF